MKKVLTAFMVLAMLFAAFGCSKGDPVSSTAKSKPVADAEAAIAAIGEVSLDSKELIEQAEKLYNILTDSEKSNVENRLALVEAREEYDRLKQEADDESAQAIKETVYNNAKEAYEKINEAADVCINGMDDIYGAWKFGIYDADDYSSLDIILLMMSMDTPNLSSSDLEAACNQLGFSASYLKSDFSYCVAVAQKAIEQKQLYAKAENALSSAFQLLQELTDEYEDFTYYPKLKEYYSKVSSYFDFFQNPTGSFKQLADTINDYENSIRTLKSDVGFLFK